VSDLVEDAVSSLANGQVALESSGWLLSVQIQLTLWQVLMVAPNLSSGLVREPSSDGTSSLQAIYKQQLQNTSYPLQARLPPR
jgi:hypothetical protein